MATPCASTRSCTPTDDALQPISTPKRGRVRPQKGSRGQAGLSATAPKNFEPVQIALKSINFDKLTFQYQSVFSDFLSVMLGSACCSRRSRSSHCDLRRPMQIRRDAAILSALKFARDGQDEDATENRNSDALK